MEYTVQNLEYAVSVFYHGDATERTKAHTWLTTAQRAPEAWNFVWELLQPTKGTEIQFYAATTLHTKILRCWFELPPDSYDELQKKILVAILAYMNGPKIVTNRLCISLAAFILQQGTIDLPASLSPLSSIENSALLLEVLTVIPEEFNSMTMGTALRGKNRAALSRACTMVIEDMMGILQSVYNDYSVIPPSETVLKSWTTAATCVASWLTFGSDEFPNSCMSFSERSPILRTLQLAVHLIYTYESPVCGLALEASEACLNGIRAAGTHGDAVHYEASAVQMLTDLASLAAPMVTANNVPDSSNEELLCAMITCLVAVAACHSSSIVSNVRCDAEHEGVKLLLQVFLGTQAAPGYYPVQETRSNLVFGFWYTLQDEILNLTEGTQKIEPIWTEVYSQLLMILIMKSEMPPQSDLCRDDQELLRCYRQDIADTIIFCYAVLGEVCWDLVKQAFEAGTTERRREACLHTFGALADVAHKGTLSPSLLFMLQRAVELVHVTTEKRTLDTALECIGTYASWISTLEEQEAHALGERCVRVAGGALAHSPASAALALRRLATDCATPASALVGDIVNAALSADGTCDGWVRRQLTCAAGAALAASTPKIALPLLKQLSQHIVNEITLQVQEGEASGRQSGSETCVGAECGASLIAALCTQSVLAAELFNALLPALYTLANTGLVEPLFQVLKQTVSSLMGECAPLIDDIVNLTITGFEKQPSATGLDLVRLTVMMVGDECPQVRCAFSTGVNTTARLLAPEVQTAMQAPDATHKYSRPDLMEALFMMLYTLTKKKPHYFDWIEESVAELVQLACWLVVRAGESRPARSGSLWLCTLAARRPRALREAAPQLTHSILRSIGGASSRNHMETLAELLLALNCAEWGSGELAGWLRAALETPDFPSPHATANHKREFIDAVIREKSSKRRMLDSVHRFSLVCRGLIDTEYARQSLAAKQLVA